MLPFMVIATDRKTGHSKKRSDEFIGWKMRFLRRWVVSTVDPAKQGHLCDPKSRKTCRRENNPAPRRFPAAMLQAHRRLARHPY